MESTTYVTSGNVVVLVVVIGDAAMVNADVMLRR